MRILIVCQVVDPSHSNLGFFVRWIEEFAKHAESVVVIASAVGTYTPPRNVALYSLGKERGVRGVGRIVNFFRLITSLQYKYDSIFCHMSPEFVLAGGWWWRLMGKRIGLWYVHGTVSVRLRIALMFTHRAFTASTESLRIKSPKVVVVGHGVDTAFFSPDSSVVRGRHMLSVGRLMLKKRHDRAIERAKIEGRPLRIAGDGPLRAPLESLAAAQQVEVHFLGGIGQEELRNEYRRAAHLFHASETGSIDKVVLEAMACDTPVVSTSPVFAHMPLARGSAFVREQYSLEQLIPRILAHYA